MKLHYSPTSPYVRKVMVTLHETGQLKDADLISTHTTPLQPAEGYADVNPLTKVPALITDDGKTIYDSRVICRYLDTRANAGLYGIGGSTWDIQTLEATGEGITDAALLMVYEGRLRTEEQRSAAWSEGQWKKIAGALDVLERRWMAHLSAPLNAGQIAVGCALGYLDFRHDNRNWRFGHPELAAWLEGFGTRPSMISSAPPA